MSGELQTRANTLKFRVNDEEQRFILEKCKKSGMSLSQYLRHAAMKRRESQRSALLQELATLNCRLLHQATNGNAQLDFERVATAIAQLVEMAEAGDLR